MTRSVGVRARRAWGNWLSRAALIVILPASLSGCVVFTAADAAVGVAAFAVETTASAVVLTAEGVASGVGAAADLVASDEAD